MPTIMGGDSREYLPQQAKRDVNPDSFASTAEQASGCASDFLRRIESLTDRLCGGVPPSAESTGQIRSIPNGYFDEAADHSRAVITRLELAGRCLDRIERALP